MFFRFGEACIYVLKGNKSPLTIFMEKVVKQSAGFDFSAICLVDSTKISMEMFLLSKGAQTMFD